MSSRERGRVIRLAEAQGRIPGPAGEHSVSLLQRGTLNVKLSRPVRPTDDLAVWVVFYGPPGGEVTAR